MQYSGTRIEPADGMDVDVEEVTRKRARIEARRKFRIVTSTIVACGRFRFVLEVDAEKPEQAESEILASLGNLGLQPLSEESVDARVTRRQGLGTTYRGVGEGLIAPPNASSYGPPSIPNQGHSMIEPEKNSSYEQAEGEVTTLPSANNYGSLSLPNYTTGREESQLYEQAEGEMVTMLYGTDYETFHAPRQAFSSVDCQNSNGVQYEQTEGELITLANTTNGSPSVPNLEHPISEPVDTKAYEQEIWKFLDKPDLPQEDFVNSAPEEGGVQDPSRRMWSDWEPLENLRKMDGNTQHWATLASELNDEITKKIQDLESGSGRAKVQQLYKDAEEITKRIGTIGSISEGKKTQKMQPKVTSNTLPTVRDVGQYLIEIFEKLKLHVSELSNNMHGRQKQDSSLTAMGRLIEDGRKALGTLGRGTNWISDKLTTLQKDLKFRELTVDRHFQKCAEVMPALVESFLKQRKGNFISMASLIDWYFEDTSVRKDLKESSSPAYDFNEILSVL
ncbi:unnamed protein product [Calypogeia fissa]